MSCSHRMDIFSHVTATFTKPGQTCGRRRLKFKVTSSADDLDTPIKFISVSTLTLTVAFAHLRIFHPPQLEGSLKPLWADIQNAALSGCHFHPCVVTHYISPRTMFPTVGMDSVLSAQPALHLWRQVFTHFFPTSSRSRSVSRDWLHPPKCSSVIISFAASPRIGGRSFSLSLWSFTELRFCPLSHTGSTSWFLIKWPGLEEKGHWDHG